MALGDHMARKPDPEKFVNDNEDILAEIIKHSSNTFTRALALAAVVEYGDEPTTDTVLAEVEQLEELRQGRDE